MSEPVYITRCRLCSKEQKNPPLHIPLTGEPGKAGRAFLERLLLHITTRHTSELLQGKAHVEQFQSFLILNVFDSEDPSVRDRVEILRARCFKDAQRIVPTEQDIGVLIHNLKFSNEEDAEKARQGFLAIRDMCCELVAVPVQNNGR
jgi:hypothetical protein